ncbi:MAG: hypothetical protein HY586_02475 [Candidatus Omnitrophica bacterium]|nr:hypothetical protein [Candidatus Omnitrophota bacterium]
MPKKTVRRLTQQMLALSVAIVFTSVNMGIGFAQAPAVSNAPILELAQNLRLPSELGSIVSLYVPPVETSSSSAPSPQKFFIHIQDAHSNETAQRNIAALLDYLQTNEEVKLFGFEGAVNELAPQMLEFSPNLATNLHIADFLLKKGSLTGGELFALKNAEAQKAGAIELIGMEQKELYVRDLKNFRRGLENQARLEPVFEKLTSNLGRMKNNAFGVTLNRFDRAYQNFRTRDEKNLQFSLRFIRNQAKETLSLDLASPFEQNKFPHLTRMSLLLDTETLVDMEKCTQQSRRILSMIDKALTKSKEPRSRVLLEAQKEVLENLFSASPSPGHFRSWREYFESLRRTVNQAKYHWRQFPDFQKLAMRLVFQEELAGPELFREMDALVYEIEMKMASGDQQKNLINLDKNIRLLLVLVRLEASREEVEAVRGDIGFFEHIRAQYEKQSASRFASLTSSEDWEALEEQFQTVMKFYDGAHEREAAFVQRLLEEAAKRNTGRVAFVAGGYHTRGICDELKKRGVAYATVMPAMANGEETLSAAKQSEKMYQERMLGKQKTIFDAATSHIVSPLGETVPENLQALDGAPGIRIWVKDKGEAIAVNFLAFVEDMLRQSPSIDTLEALAQAINEQLRKNPYLKNAGFTVEAAEESLLIGWKNYRAKYPVPVDDMARIHRLLQSHALKAIEPAPAEPELVQGSSLGEEPTRRDVLRGALAGFAGLFLGRVLPGFAAGAVAGAAGCGHTAATVTIFNLPTIALEDAAVSEAQTSHLSKDQPITQREKERRWVTASPTGGSTEGTKVFKEKTNTILLDFDHRFIAHPTDSTQDTSEWSGIAFSRQNFDDQDGQDPTKITVDDYIDGAQIGELVLNIERIAGDIPARLKIEFEDDQGVELFYILDNFKAEIGRPQTLRIRLDNNTLQSPDPSRPRFNLHRFSFNLVSDSTKEKPQRVKGQLRVTVRGVDGLYRVQALPNAVPLTTSLNAIVRPDPSNALPRQAAMFGVGGAVPGNSVQEFLSNAMTTISRVVAKIVSKHGEGLFGGASISADDGKGIVKVEEVDLMDGSGLHAEGGLRLNHQFISPDSDRPANTIVEVITYDLDPQTEPRDATRRYRTLVEGLGSNNQGIMIPFDPDMLPEGFVPAGVQYINMVYEEPAVPDGETPVTKNVEAQIEIFGHKTDLMVTVGKPFDPTDPYKITYFSTFGLPPNTPASGDAEIEAFSTPGATTPTILTPQADGITYDVQVSTERLAGTPDFAHGTESGIRIKPPQGRNFQLGDPIHINVEQTGGQVGSLPNNLIVRYTGSAGKTFERYAPVIHGNPNAIPPDKVWEVFGYVIETNKKAVPAADPVTGDPIIDRDNIVSIDIIYQEPPLTPGQPTSHTGTVRITVGKSLGESVSNVPTERIAADLSGTPKESVLASLDLTDSILPLIEDLAIRYPGYSREQIASILAVVGAQVLAETGQIGVAETLDSKRQALIQMLEQTYALFGREPGYGLEIEIMDKPLTMAEFRERVEAAKWHSNVFRTIVSLDPKHAVENARIAEAIQKEKDYGGRPIAKRFVVIQATPENLNDVLRQLPSDAFNSMKRMNLETGPKNVSELLQHTVLIGASEYIEGAGVRYTQAVRIKENIPEDSRRSEKLAVLRMFLAHVAAKSYAGLSPEMQSSIPNREAYAEDLVADANLTAIQNEIKAVMQILVAA